MRLCYFVYGAFGRVWIFRGAKSWNISRATGMIIIIRLKTYTTRAARPILLGLWCDGSFWVHWVIELQANQGTCLVGEVYRKVCGVHISIESRTPHVCIYAWMMLLIKLNLNCLIYCSNYASHLFIRVSLYIFAVYVDRIVLFSCLVFLITHTFLRNKPWKKLVVFYCIWKYSCKVVFFYMNNLNVQLFYFKLTILLLKLTFRNYFSGVKMNRFDGLRSIFFFILICYFVFFCVWSNTFNIINVYWHKLIKIG